MEEDTGKEDRIMRKRKGKNRNVKLLHFNALREEIYSILFMYQIERNMKSTQVYGRHIVALYDINEKTSENDRELPFLNLIF